VCPTCPACSNGVCVQCGGKGGSGAKDRGGANGGSGEKHRNDEVIHEIGRDLNKGLREGGDLAQDAVTTIGKDVDKGLRGVGSLLQDGATTIGKDIKHVSDAILPHWGGGVGEINNNYNNYINYSPPPPIAGRYTGYQDQTQNIKNTYNSPSANSPPPVPGVDIYSYYGALVPKDGNSNNYMPVMSDFSHFGR